MTYPQKALAFLFFLSTMAQGFTPLPGQIARFQPHMRKLYKQAWQAEGKVTVSSTKLPYELRWYGSGDYAVVFDDIPNSFISSFSTSAGKWVLRRKDGQCSLMAGKMVVFCGRPGFWAQMELMGAANGAASALKSAGFYDDMDIAFVESNSKDPFTEPSQRRVKAVLGTNGGKPQVVLEVRGPNFQASSQSKVGGFPVIHFDPSFLSPLMASFSWESQVVTLAAKSDTDVRRRYPRFRPRLSEELTLYSGNSPRATVTRAINEEVKGRKVEKIKIPGARVGVESLRSELSASGRHFLDWLLLTH